MRKLLLLIIFSKKYKGWFILQPKNMPVITIHRVLNSYIQAIITKRGMTEEEVEASLINEAKLNIAIDNRSYGSKNIDTSILNI